jgi:hypothetical protein
LRPLASSLIAGLALGAGLGCGGASPLSGITANLRVANAQFVTGALAADTTAMGPQASQVALPNTTVFAGQQNLAANGAVEGGSTVLIGLGDDIGYWIVPATTIDAILPNAFDFSAQLTFSPLIPLGQHPLIFRGVASDGTVGPALVYQMTVSGYQPPPAGALVVTLEWDTESDMDLHVDVPNPADPSTPIEIWYKAAVGLPPRGPADPPFTADQIAAAGYLDFDSNAACLIDGRRQENVIFPTGQTPPSGQYTVRVDANSLCGQPDAQWQVTAGTADGTQLGFAQWEATDADTRGAHTVGSGRLAFDFTIP